MSSFQIHGFHSRETNTKDRRCASNNIIYNHCFISGATVMVLPPGKQTPWIHLWIPPGTSCDTWIPTTRMFPSAEKQHIRACLWTSTQEAKNMVCMCLRLCGGFCLCEHRCMGVRFSGVMSCCSFLHQGKVSLKRLLILVDQYELSVRVDYNF